MPAPHWELRFWIADEIAWSGLRNGLIVRLMSELTHHGGIEVLILRIGKDTRLLLLGREQDRRDHGLQILQTRDRGSVRWKPWAEPDQARRSAHRADHATRPSEPPPSSVGSSAPGRNARRSFKRVTIRWAVSEISCANDVDHGLLKFLDHSQIHQRSGNRQLQPELLADFTSQPKDRIDESNTVDSGFARLFNRIVELTIDDLLHPGEAIGGRELLVDEGTGLFERDDVRGEALHLFEPLVDRGFGDAEVAGGVGLGVAGVQKLTETVGIDLGFGHGCFSERKLNLMWLSARSNCKVASMMPDCGVAVK